MSSDTAIGVSESIARMRRRSSPSPSSKLSVTIAPCRSSMMPSKPPLATASQIMPAMCSKAASSTARLGGAPAAIGYDHLRPFALGEIEIGPETRSGAAIGPDRRIAIKRPRPSFRITRAKAGERGRYRRERVGLVLHHRDQQAHRGNSCQSGTIAAAGGSQPGLSDGAPFRHTPARALTNMPLTDRAIR